MDTTTEGTGLTTGPCWEIILNADGSLSRIWPLPYTGLAGGALKGCASVLNTSAPALVSDFFQLDSTLYLHSSRLTRFGSAKVRYLHKVGIRLRVKADSPHDSQVLQDLPEPKALHIVDEPRVGRVDVVDTRVRDSRGEILQERVHRVRRALDVLPVARDAPCVEVGLEHLRTEVVVLVTRVDEEPVLLVEGEVPRGGRSAGVVAVGREVAEDLRADARAVMK